MEVEGRAEIMDVYWFPFIPLSRGDSAGDCWVQTLAPGAGVWAEGGSTEELSDVR